MYFNNISKDRLVRLFPDIIEGIDYYDWHDIFPSILGYIPFLPENFEEGEQSDHIFRSDDRIIAAEMAKYPEFHPQMVDIINQMIVVNRESKMWDWDINTEFPGISFADALASLEIKNLDLYADFLLSIKPELQVQNLEFDIVRLIKKWNWESETYYLLLTYWFSEHKEKSEVLNYLSQTGFSLNDKLHDDFEVEKFIGSLALFLTKSEYPHDELQGKYTELFDELVDEYIFPKEKEKADYLKTHYLGFVEKLSIDKSILPENNIPENDLIEEYPEEEIPILGPEIINNNELTQPIWSWDDEDIPEI